MGAQFGLTPKQKQLLDFIKEFSEETGESPSFEQMKEACELKSKSGVHRLVIALEERGLIRRLPYRDRSISVVQDGPEGLGQYTTAALTAELLRRQEAFEAEFA